MAAMLFMRLSGQTSFKNVVKPWRENANLKKINKSDLNQKPNFLDLKKIMIFSNSDSD